MPTLFEAGPLLSAISPSWRRTCSRCTLEVMMKLSTKSSVTILGALALSLAYVACTNTPSSSSRTAADNPSATPAANPSGYADRSSISMTSADQDFLKKAAQGNMAEIELGNLAQQRGASSYVKDYGKKLVEDHTKMLNDLKEIASKANLAL